jgi:hypothetical protein
VRFGESVIGRIASESQAKNYLEGDERIAYTYWQATGNGDSKMACFRVEVEYQRASGRVTKVTYDSVIALDGREAARIGERRVRLDRRRSTVSGTARADAYRTAWTMAGIIDPVDTFRESASAETARAAVAFVKGKIQEGQAANDDLNFFLDSSEKILSRLGR